MCPETKRKQQFMAINYAFYKTSGITAKEESKTIARIKTHHRRNLRDLAQEIKEATTATEGDILLVVESLVSKMASAMLQGCNVEIDGLGTFSLSLGGDVRENKNGDPYLHNPHVRGVNFRPNRDFLKRFASANFTSRNLPAHISRPATDEEVREKVVAALREHTVLSFDKIRDILQMTTTTARRRLRPLIDDGTILSIGTRAKAFYRLGEGQE